MHFLLNVEEINSYIDYVGNSKLLERKLKSFLDIMAAEIISRPLLTLFVQFHANIFG